MLILNLCSCSFAKAVFQPNKSNSSIRDFTIDFFQDRYDATVSVISCDNYDGDSMGDFTRILVLHDEDNDFDFTVTVELRGSSIYFFDYERTWVVNEEYETVLAAHEMAEHGNVEIIESENSPYFSYEVVLQTTESNLSEAIAQLVEWSETYDDIYHLYLSLELTDDKYKSYRPLTLFSTTDIDVLKFRWNRSLEGQEENLYLEKNIFLQQGTSDFIARYQQESNKVD